MENSKNDVGDIASLFANDGDKDDNLMTEIDNFINNKPLDSPVEEKAETSTEQVMNMRIKQEDGSGFIMVSALTKRPAKAAPKPKKTIKKSMSRLKAKKSFKSSNLPIQSVMPHVKLEPLSDDEFTEIEKTSGSSEKDSASKAQDEYCQESTSSLGKCKALIKELRPDVKAIHGFKLNATPVVLLEKLDLSKMSLKLSLLSECSPKPSKPTDVVQEQNSPSMSKKVDMTSLIKRSPSIPKPKSIVQESLPDKSKPETASKVFAAKTFLGLGERHLSEPISSTGTFKYELSLSPIVLADLSSDPFRKFMNLALDCAVHFRKNQNQPLFGNISLYFGDFSTLRSAMQRLCQLPVNTHNMWLNGTIKCFDFTKLESKSEDEPAKKSLIGRLMFRFCAQRIEKLQQLASMKDRKKESKKVHSALINKVPAALTREMLMLLYPFSLDVRFLGDKHKQTGLKGPVSIDFESQEWMEAVLDCTREHSVNMSCLSGTELSTFRLYVKNYTPPKIPLGKAPEPAKPAIPSLMSTPVQPSMAVGRERDRGRAGPGPREGRNDGTNRDKERAAGGSGLKPHSQMDRKRHHDDRSVSRPNSEEKRGRFDGSSPNRKVETPVMRELYPPADTQLPADPKQAIRLAAVAKGLNPNNPDVIKILEMSSQLQALQKVSGPGMMAPGQPVGTGLSGPVFPQQQQHLMQREMFRSPVSSGSLSQERMRVMSPDTETGRQATHFVYSERPASRWDQGQHDENLPRHLATHRDSSRGGFRNSPRNIDSSSFHSRSRDSPGTHPLQRDRSGSGNRSRSPQESNSSSSSSSAHRPGGFAQRGGRVEMHTRNREMANASSDFDPSKNDQPLDFQRPPPVLSTEQAVQQDMARTMQTLWQGDKRQEGRAAHSFDGRHTQQQQPRAEELVLPLQFGKNAVKKTPQAIMEEKLQKEREERQKREIERRKKREEEERQKKEREMEERHKRQREEREMQDKELETRRRTMGPSFTPVKDQRRPGPHYSDPNRDQFEPFDNPPRPGNDFFRPNQTPNQYTHGGVRFQGEGEESFQHGSHTFSAEKPRRKDTSPNIWDKSENGANLQRAGPPHMQIHGGFQKDNAPNIWNKAEKGDNTLQRAGPPHVPNRGGFQKDNTPNIWDKSEKGDHTLQRAGPSHMSNRGGFHRGGHMGNVSARGDFHQGGPSFGPDRSFEGTTHDKQQQNMWDAHDQVHRDTPDRPSRAGPMLEQRDRWSKQASDRFKPSNTWDSHDAPSEDVEGGHQPGRHFNTAVRRSAGGRILTNRSSYGRGMVEWTSSEQEPQAATTHVSAETYRGRGSVRTPMGARGAMRGRGLARGNLNVHADDPQRLVGYEHDSIDDELIGHSPRNSSMVTHPKPGHRPPPQREILESRDEFGFQEKGSGVRQWQRGGFQGSRGGHQQTMWNNSNHGSQSQRDGPVRGHPQGHALASRGRGGRHFARNEYFEEEWQNTQENSSSQFEEVSFDDESGDTAEPAPWEQHKGWTVEARTTRGRGGTQRIGRGLAGRGREYTSYGRGFGGANTTEERFPSDDKDGDYYEGFSEYPTGSETTQQDCKDINVPRGRGFRSRGAGHMGGRGMPAFRGTEKREGRGMPAFRGTEKREGRGMPAFRGTEKREGRGMPAFRGTEKREGRGMPAFRGTEKREGRGMPAFRGTEKREGRGMPAFRGTESRGGRGVQNFRGTENQRGRGVHRYEKETFLAADSDPAQPWDGQYGGMHENDQANLTSPGRLQEWSPGSRGAPTSNRGRGGAVGAAPSRGASNLWGRGATRGTGAPFRGLLPNPL